MRHVAETTGAELEELYSQIAWPLYKLYGHAFDALKVMVQEPDAVYHRLLQVRLSSGCPIVDFEAPNPGQRHFDK